MDDVTRTLVDQHIREYDFRLQRVDELFAQAKKEAAQHARQTEINAQLEQMKRERDKLAGWLDELRHKPIENWREDEIREAGPMGIWDAVAQQLERLVERIER